MYIHSFWDRLIACCKWRHVIVSYSFAWYIYLQTCRFWEQKYLMKVKYHHF